MKMVTINAKQYEYHSNIRDKQNIRRSFDDLAQKTFGISFESWYQAGFWGDCFRPHVLMDRGSVVSNVSASILDFTYQGQKQRYVQLGTVMTHPDYQRQGLSRFLMETILAEWKSRCDIIYLFANKTVLDFYPKFGFTKATEYRYKKKIERQTGRLVRLDMSSEEGRRIFLDKAKAGNPFSAFSPVESSQIALFYCTQSLKDCVYLLPDLDAIIVAEHNGPELLCYDVFSGKDSNLDQILAQTATEETTHAVLGFTPISPESFVGTPINEPDNTLFVLPSQPSMLSQDSLMFPLLSHT